MLSLTLHANILFLTTNRSDLVSDMVENVLSVYLLRCMYVFLWLFGLLGPGSNGSVQVSDRDSRRSSWRSSETMEGGGGWDER